MVNFYDIFVAGSLFTSFITSILLFTRGRYQLHANRLLGTVIFSWFWYVLLYFLVITGWLKHIPGIFRIGSPLYYLIPCCSYLYVRSVLLDEIKFRKYDWLHFIPAILNVVDLLPYYFADAETKRAVADAIVNNFNMSYQKGSGIVPAFWHFQLRWILGIVYLLFQWLLLAKVIKRDKLEAFKEVKGWLIAFTVFCSIIYLGLGIMSVIAWVNLGSKVSVLSSARSVPTLLQVIGFTCLSVYLFFKPEVLYGIPRSNYTLPENKADEVPDATGTLLREAPFNPELMQAYVAQLETYMQKEAPFRQQGFVINELALALKMPLHHLSYVLNNHYKQRFTDFINSFRIDYVKMRMESGDWRSLTLEGLAKESGFSSRSTFSVSFKKFTGVTPSQYLQLRKSK
ncbi:AraC-like DNA-binding protein [Pedobacter sp. AK017]|uniref:helix-turn-helix domain-containing protein n=1 Tax=Pedobacter sp. AK017 TaxID=2723073 RepID=UPI00161BD3D5|nr:helix-turn-helix domain-containing protein [Pedobacter sp. AK017]MBB5439289.1 AraC-like DNA-binding protein [Pedobacter sp. AK017]